MEILKSIILKYSDNKIFEEDLKSPSFFNRLSVKEKKYTLYEFELYKRKKVKENIKIEFSNIFTDEFSIEHIWPVNPRDLNDKLTEIHEACVQKLGNLTLVSRSWNSNLGNKNFNEKIKRYSNSSFLIQRELKDKKEWTQLEIQNRTQEIVDFAFEKWNYRDKPSSIIII
ncbi:MAG: HNH endonuclease family protein [Candidatus Thorarchaeota archaeon]